MTTNKRQLCMWACIVYWNITHIIFAVRSITVVTTKVKHASTVDSGLRSADF